MAYTPVPPVGQTTKSASLPVTLASDQDALPITDNGGSLTVDGTVTAAQATAANLNATVVGTGTFVTQSVVTQGTATNLKAQAENYQGGTAVSSSNPLEVNVRSTTGSQSVNTAQVNGVTVNVGTGAASTGTQRVTTSTDSTIGTVTSVTALGTVTPGTAAANLGKAEDAIHGSGDVGVMALGVANVAQSTLSADGDYSIQATDLKGNQYVALRDTLGNSTNSAGNGFLKVTDEPRQIFYDPFDAAPDTTNMWTSTTGSSGVAASVTTGVLSMGTGTTANGYSKFTSIPTFKPTIPGWVVYSDAIQIPDAAAPTANSLRFWGVGTTPATPTVAAPITDGFFFELSTAGVLSAVVYAGGTRTSIATSLTLNTGYVRYIIQVRTDRTYFYINTIDSAGLVATTSFNQPQIQTLPKLFLAVGNSTPPVSNSQIQCTGAVVSDTGKNSTQLSDGLFPWRRQTIKAASTAAVAADLPAVVAIHPTSPLPTGSNTIGALTANQSVNTAQVNGAAVNVGTGAAGTGTQRVTTSTDSTIGTVTTLTGTTTLTPGTGASNLGKAEDAAHASGDTGVAVWGVRNDTLATGVTNASGDYSQISVGTDGAVIVTSAPRALKVTPTVVTITSSTTETTVLAAVASTFLDLYGITFNNTSATACKVTLRDATAGTVRWTGTVPAGDMRGFMLDLDSAIPQTTVNNNWTVQCGTSVASIEVTLFAVKRV